MTEPGAVVQTLQDLGITRNEAEVYLATLQESQGEPVSGYRVAQSVGKDPANFSKTLASLEILGAVRSIQEKPRLYLPIDPAEFTNKLIADMENNRQQVLKHLQALESNQQLSIPMALANRNQALAKASELMSHCRRELLLFADGQTLKQLGTNLEALAASSDVKVCLLSIENFNMQGVEESTMGKPAGFADPEPVPWLQMIVDKREWLTASFASVGADKMPCGWWSSDPALALIFGASLVAAMEGTVEMAEKNLPQESLKDVQEGEFVPENIAGPMIESTLESVHEPRPEATTESNEISLDEEPLTKSPEPENHNENKDDDDELQFIIRHEDDQ